MAAVVVTFLFAMGVAVPTWVLHTPREMKPVVFSVLPNNNWPLVKAHLPFVFGAHIVGLYVRASESRMMIAGTILRLTELASSITLRSTEMSCMGPDSVQLHQNAFYSVETQC